VGTKGSPPVLREGEKAGGAEVGPFDAPQGREKIQEEIKTVPAGAALVYTDKRRQG
jgi:hypothetical protein